MNRRGLTLRSLWFYRRTQAGVLAGAGLAAMVLVGALVIGDSVRFTLTQIVLERLGRTEFAMVSGSRFFRADLAERLAAEIPVDGAAILQLSGMAVADGGVLRANDIRVLGVDHDFWRLAPRPSPRPPQGNLANAAHRSDSPEAGEAWVNRKLARQLQLEPGDEIIVRIRRPGLIPGDIALSGADHETVALRVKVTAVLSSSDFGGFTLAATQIPPANIFVSRDWLCAVLSRPAAVANVLLAAPAKDQPPLKAAELKSALARAFRLKDAGLSITKLAQRGQLQLTSERVFLERQVLTASHQIMAEGQPIFAYLVNEIRADASRATPYSFIAAPGPGGIAAGLGSDEIIVNDWLAADLNVAVGDTLSLRYYVPDQAEGLREKTRQFRVKTVVPVRSEDRDLAPSVPGLLEVENCRDWKPGIPLDLNAIRDQDEVYWDNYRSTPKAYVSLTAAREMWENRYGNATALRFPKSATATAAAATEALRQELTPAEFGLVWQAVKTTGLQAGREAVDFGQLFLGLSFFLIAAAILLVILLFTFNLEERAAETATLRALGFTPAGLRALHLREGLIVATCGTLLGTALAIVYNRVMLLALQTVWRDAVRTSAFEVQIRPATLVSGATVSLLLAIMSIWLMLRRQGQVTIRALYQSAGGPGDSMLAKTSLVPRYSLLAGAGLIIVALVLVAGLAQPGRDRAAAAIFFGAGTLLLTGLLCLVYAALRWQRQKAGNPTTASLAGLAWQGCRRRPARSLTTMAMLASGLFLVFAVAANRRGEINRPERRKSGTGGFELFATATLGITGNWQTQGTDDQFGLNKQIMNGTIVVPMLLREGTDASCLNLNRVDKPHLLGVDPKALQGRFTFAQIAPEVEPHQPWNALSQNLGENIVPGVADQAVITWSLGRKIGDTLSYVDESGTPFQIKLVGGLTNSTLQGYVIISQQHMRQRWPSLSGSRVMLIDTPPGQAAAVSGELTRQLSDLGMACQSAATRLAEFNTVENTYLSIFLVLGGLGLVLGSAGLGLVVMRNILERRSELALLRALGFTKHRLRRLMLLEHGALALIGLLIGIIAAGVASWPAWSSPGNDPPIILIGTILLLIGSTAFAGIWLIANLALRDNLLAALRNE